jgi:amino-acid N-acetyltransferase
MTNANTSIRPAVDADLPSITSLLIANELPIEGVAEALRGFLVAEADNRIIGVVGTEYCGGYALLRSTVVDSAWRGRQVARQLVDRAIDEAKMRGTRAVYLLTTTAEHYFPSFGFATVSRDTIPEPIRQTREFLDACPASAVAMTLPLQETPASP